MANPAPAPASGMPASDPNKTLLILAWVFAILFSLVGLILSIVGLNKKDRRFKAPLIVSIVLMALGILYYVVLGSMMK